MYAAVYDQFRCLKTDTPFIIMRLDQCICNSNSKRLLIWLLWEVLSPAQSLRMPDLFKYCQLQVSDTENKLVRSSEYATAFGDRQENMVTNTSRTQTRVKSKANASFKGFPREDLWLPVFRICGRLINATNEAKQIQQHHFNIDNLEYCQEPREPWS